MRNVEVYVLSTFQIIKHFVLANKVWLPVCKLSATGGKPLGGVKAGSEVLRYCTMPLKKIFSINELQRQWAL